MTMLAQHLSTSNDWGTPAYYMEAVRLALGGDIDLDPASDTFFNQVVQARAIYTEADDGLSHPWRGRVFLNAPYGWIGGRSSQEIWSAYLYGQYSLGNVQAAVLLANAAPGAGWFQTLWRKAALCFPDRRVRFYRRSGSASQPTHDNVFAYFGPDHAAFRAAFRSIGTILPQGVAICKGDV